MTGCRAGLDLGGQARSAMIMLTPVVISVAPGAASLDESQTQQLTANVTGAHGNTAVVWSMSPNVGTVTAGGLYTAPAAIGMAKKLMVKATSAADISRIGGYPNTDHINFLIENGL